LDKTKRNDKYGVINVRIYMDEGTSTRELNIQTWIQKTHWSCRMWNWVSSSL